MRKIKKVILLIVVYMIVVSMKANTAFAESTIQVIPVTTTNPVWTGITVSDAYDICQKLNKNYSTLGTESLKAHLTTNADWYAVSLLSYSSYGNKNASNTTGNNTGIINFGSKLTFTSSVMEGTTANDNRKSLYDNINTPYVESVKNNTDRVENETGRGLLAKEYLTGNLGYVYYGNKSNYPICVRGNLFGFMLGETSDPLHTGWVDYGASGLGANNITFRPVIWNK